MTPETEAFLAQVRDAEGPTVEAEQRVLEAVRAAVALPPPAAATTTTTAPATVTATTTTLGLKTVLKLTLCVAGITATTLAVQRVNTPPSARAPREASAPPVQPTTIVHPRTPQPTSTVEPTAPQPTSTIEPIAAPLAPFSPKLRHPTPDLQAELTFLSEVHTSLRRGDGAEALRRLDAHRTTDRQLLAERRAARVFALCATGHIVDAQREAATFVRRHPNAPQREAVERACADPARE